MITPIGDHVRYLMAGEAGRFEAEIAGKTTADTDLIVRLGRSLWPKASVVLVKSAVPDSWAATRLDAAAYRSLAAIIAALLQQAALLEAVCAETAEGLLPPQPEIITRMLRATMVNCAPALPMLIVLLLARLPQTMALITPKYVGPQAGIIQAALLQATERLLQRLRGKDAVESEIAAGTLTEAGAAASRIMTLLDQLRVGIVSQERREQMQSIRRRLDASCRNRFATGLQEELLRPLQQLRHKANAEEISAMEDAARGLRALELAARAIGGGSGYDLLLIKAREAVQSDVVRDHLQLVDRVRLIEILAGPDAALTLLKSPR